MDAILLVSVHSWLVVSNMQQLVSSPLLEQGVAAKIKGIGASPGLDSSQVAHVLGDGRGCHADLVVAQMETKGIGRIDFYEVGDVLDRFAVRDNVEVAVSTFRARERLQFVRPSI